GNSNTESDRDANDCSVAVALDFCHSDRSGGISKCRLAIATLSTTEIVRDVSTALDMTKATLVAVLAAAIAQSISAQNSTETSISEIQSVIRAQQDAWNRGDIDAFMNGYWQSENTVFVSGDEVTRGWQKVLDRYKAKYSDRAKMGSLTFSDLEITPLSNESAIALGSWKLKRASDQPHGRFTLIFRKFSDGWKIIHDHTSAAQPDLSGKQERKNN
ncbi:MAG TPA: nuclear transport factor 2 family protein, partial [Chthoniobacterales bacterium]|nr:nuclear transport factor 2 family protein [Chthoniobacterales bacterium]